MQSFYPARRNPVLQFLLILFLSACGLARADLVTMQNGDRYVGKVSVLNTNTLVLQSEILGTVQLPRSKVTAIALGTNVANSSAQLVLTNGNPAVPAITPPNSEVPAALRNLAKHTNLIQQVQTRFLADAGPEATAKFNDLLNGLATGKMNLDDLRAEARSSVAQLRELKRELGEQDDSPLDLYLSVLDKFLKDSPAPAGAATNTNRPPTK